MKGSPRISSAMNTITLSVMIVTSAIGKLLSGRLTSFSGKTIAITSPRVHASQRVGDHGGAGPTGLIGRVEDDRERQPIHGERDEIGERLRAQPLARPGAPRPVGFRQRREIPLLLGARFGRVR